MGREAALRRCFFAHCPTTTYLHWQPQCLLAIAFVADRCRVPQRLLGPSTIFCGIYVSAVLCNLVHVGRLLFLAV